MIFNEKGQAIVELGWLGKASKKFIEEKARPYQLSIKKEKAVYLHGHCLNLDSMGSSKNFYHYLREAISKIYIIDGCSPISLSQFDHIFLPKNPINRNFQEEIINHLGIRENQLCHLSNDKVFQCENLYSPSMNGKRRISRKNSFNFLKNTFKVPNNPPFRRIYVSREGYGRNIENSEDVNKILKEFDFEVIDCGKEKNILQLINSFNEAYIILGVHGAGLAHIMFSQPQTHLIEICYGNRFTPIFSSMAYANDIFYHGIATEIVEDSKEIIKSGMPRKNVIINVDILRKVIKSII
jgi:capsular polysaccharide biosynthesis protein